MVSRPGLPAVQSARNILNAMAFKNIVKEAIQEEREGDSFTPRRRERERGG